MKAQTTFLEFILVIIIFISFLIIYLYTTIYQQSSYISKINEIENKIKAVAITQFLISYSEESSTPSVNWLSGWQYRKQITITENSGNTLTDYQILITIDTATLISNNKLRSDCGDIRFTDSDGITLLNYWIESGCNSANTKIWVKVPNIPASSTKKIYMYYKNPSATSMSNARSTMLIYEDMETSPSGSLASSAIYDSTNKYVRLTPATTGQLGYLYYNFNPGPLGFYAKFRFWAGGGSGADAVWLGVYDSDYSNTREDVVNGGYHFTYDEYQDRICFTKSTSDNEAGISCASETTIDNSQWHIAEIYYWKSGTSVCTKIYYDGTLKVNACDNSPQSNAINGIGKTIFGGRTGALTNEHRIDDISVRKYVYPEPSVTLGSEETYIVPTTKTIFKYGLNDGTYYNSLNATKISKFFSDCKSDYNYFKNFFNVKDFGIKIVGIDSCGAQYNYPTLKRIVNINGNSYVLEIYVKI